MTRRVFLDFFVVVVGFLPTAAVETKSSCEEVCVLFEG